LDGRNIEKKVIVCEESKHTTYCGPLERMAVEGKRGSVQGGPDPGESAGRAGFAWIRTKESLKTNDQATWVSSVLPLVEGGQVRLPGSVDRAGFWHRFVSKKTGEEGGSSFEGAQRARGVPRGLGWGKEARPDRGPDLSWYERE